jgi:DNA excision repair protein ERCC-4
MKVIIDTREQLPLFNRGEYKKLEVGDYTTDKLLNKFHIERKSLSDLYGTLTKGNNRFKYELFRAAYHHINIECFVEGTREDFINKRFPKGQDRKFSKEGLDRLISTFEKKYFLKFVWCKNRQDCAKKTALRLEEMEKGRKHAKKG